MTTQVTTALIADAAITQAKMGPNVAGNGPAFSAYQSTLQAVANNTSTKIQLQTESFDPNANFDSTTNYRFTPTVAGYYQLNFSVGFTVTPGSVSSIDLLFYFNGAQIKIFRQYLPTGAANPMIAASQLVYFNGFTDYAEVYVSHAFGASANTTAANDRTYFQGALVRAA